MGEKAHIRSPSKAEIWSWNKYPELHSAKHVKMYSIVVLSLFITHYFNYSQSYTISYQWIHRSRFEEQKTKREDIKKPLNVQNSSNDNS